MNNWHQIWSKRSLPENADVLQALIEADGFDSPTGKLTSAQWKTYARDIVTRANIQPGDSLYEVGCGAGAFLYPFYLAKHRIGGLDYSANLIAIAKKTMPEGDFRQAGADALETDERYDVLLSNGVFFYFENYAYASVVLEKMFEKARRTIVVTDVNDLAKKAEAEIIRKGKLGEEEYKRKYEGLDQLFYDESFFRDFAAGKKSRCRIWRQNIENYGGGSYRFNVIIDR